MISYVLPVYNGAAFLPQTLESLFKQSNKDFEIIVIDDCSTDGAEFLRDHYRDQVRWTELGKREGGAHCRNLGNKWAKGDVIAVCDCGDIYTSDRGREIDRFFAKHQDKDVVYSHVQVTSGLGQPMFVQTAERWDGKSKPPISHPTVAYRSLVAQTCEYKEGCLDTDFYEFFMLDAWKAGFNFGTIQKILCHKMDLSSSESYRNIPKAKDEKFKLYQEYGIDIPREKV